MEQQSMSRRQIRELAGHVANHAISIYFPTSRIGGDVQQGPIRLKNELAKAEERLAKEGMRRTLAIDLLAPAAALVEDEAFWNERLDGVAVFLAPNFFRAVHVPFEVKELCAVGTHFQLRPLLNVLNDRTSAYILALEQGHVRLLHHGPRGIVSVAVDDMPESVETFASHEHSGKQVQTHTAGHAGQAGSIIGHGSHDKGIEERDRLRRFCAAIDKALVRHLHSSETPVVLVGTQEVQDAFRLHSKLPHLVEKGVVCSPKVLDGNELWTKASPIIDADSDQIRQKALGRYREIVGTGFTSQQIEEILPAAMTGKVDILFANDAPPVWGRFDEAAGVALIHDEPADEDEDLINRAALATIANGGRVYPVNEEDLALTGPAAAIYRY